MATTRKNGNGEDESTKGKGSTDKKRRRKCSKLKEEEDLSDESDVVRTTKKKKKKKKSVDKKKKKEEEEDEKEEPTIAKEIVERSSLIENYKDKDNDCEAKEESVQGGGEVEEGGREEEEWPNSSRIKVEGTDAAMADKDSAANNQVDDHCDVEQRDEYSDHWNDERKVFVSRIPQSFTEESIRRSLQTALVPDSSNKDNHECQEDVVMEVALVYARESEEEETETARHNVHAKTFTTTSSTTTTDAAPSLPPHRGFAFVTLSSPQWQSAALQLGTVKGTARPNSKRKYTLYIRPILRQDASFHGDKKEEEEYAKDVCYQWLCFRCPHGDACKFLHVGTGACRTVPNDQKKETETAGGSGGADTAVNKKVKLCLNFRKRGKCSKGDACPYLHDTTTTITATTKGDSAPCKKEEKTVDVNRHCFRWQTTGKCRFKDKTCPYRHDFDIQEAALAKQKLQREKKQKQKKKTASKEASFCSIRIFGLAYDTTQDDISHFLQSHLGSNAIRSLDFPTFEDSGRSRGYCGVTLTDHSAVSKALELDGSELHGRWLRVQEGRMLLREWQQREEETRRKKRDQQASFGEFGQRVKRRKRHGFDKDQKETE